MACHGWDLNVRVLQRERVRRYAWVKVVLVALVGQLIVSEMVNGLGPELNEIASGGIRKRWIGAVIDKEVGDRSPIERIINLSITS